MKLEQKVIDIIKIDVEKFIKTKITKLISEIKGIPKEQVTYNPEDSLQILSFEDMDVADLAVDAEDKFKISLEEISDKEMYKMNPFMITNYISDKIIQREEQKPTYA